MNVEFITLGLAGWIMLVTPFCLHGETSEGAETDVSEPRSAETFHRTWAKSDAGPRCAEVAPGVWRVRFGQPEKFTPLRFREHPPRLEAMARLESSDTIPIKPSEIGFRTGARGAVLELPFEAEERFYGLGMNLRVFQLSGKKTVCVSDNQTTELGHSHAPAPFYVSSRGYGVYVDTARYAAFYFGNLNALRDTGLADKSADEGRIADSTEELYRPRGSGSRSVGVDLPTARGVDLYLFAGPGMRQAVQRYNLFAGGGCLPPMWGLGAWYRASAKLDQREVTAFLREFRQRNIPCDVFGLEPGWHTRSYSSTFAWSRRFPEPERLLRETKQLGYKLNLWEHAFIHPTSPLYKPLLPWSGDFKVWDGLVPDFARPEGRALFAAYHAENFVDKGVGGFKLDECDHQPISPTPWSFPDHARFPSGLDGEQMHSLFGPLYQRTISSTYRRRNLRTVGLARASGPLAAPLPFALYSDAYNHRDYVRAIATSGFAGVLWCPEVRDAMSLEILYRRMQTSVFSAITQVDCWFLKNPPWKQINRKLNNESKFMDEWEQAETVCRDLLRLRMSLLPYLYSAYVDYHDTGVPPARAVVMDYPDESVTWTLDDQYMLGPSLMVAPLFAGEKSREVYLPKGEWYDFWTGRKYSGGRKMTVEKPVEQIPVFVKGNTLLPLAAPVDFVAPDTQFEITVRVYGDQPRSFVLFEDDGRSFDFEQGEQNRCELSWEKNQGSLRKTGQYVGVPRYKIAKWERMDEIREESFSAAAAPAPEVPNADFDQGADAPAGWKLSGGKGRWVNREFLEVTGDGKGGNYWWCKCPFAPGGLYRFQMRARCDGAGGGCVTSGPAFANRDWSLTNEWNWCGHVFRAPDGISADILRIGQWRNNGTSQFDAVSLVPVVPVYKAVGPLRLGEGESIRGGRYTFAGSFTHEGSNYHRTLHAATARFNTDRWNFRGDSQVTYRFSLPDYPFRSGSVRFGVRFHNRGGCSAEISSDGTDWRPLVAQEGVGRAAADVPTSMFPAETLFLRLRPTDQNSSFDVDYVEFSGDLTGAPPEGSGRTGFAQINQTRGDLAIEDLSMDAPEGPNRLEIRLTAGNQGDVAVRTLFSTRVAEPQGSTDPRGDRPWVETETLSPGESHVFLAKCSFVHPGQHEIRLTLTDGVDQTISVVILHGLHEYHRGDYGMRIKGIGGAADVWWCEAGWKIAPKRLVPRAESPAATLSAARNDREAVQIVVRPSNDVDLRQLSVAAGAFVGPDGAAIPAENVKVMRVHYHRVHTPTDSTGVCDEWPDALPPLNDPLDLPAGRNQPLWVLIHVPKDAVPGNYSGNLKLTADKWSAIVPLRLNVWNFTLPQRNHLETAVGLKPQYVFQYHRLKTEADKRRVWDMYMQNFAEHRVNTYYPTPLDPIRVKFLPEADPPRAELDFTAFDAAMERAIEKYHITNFRLPIEGMGSGSCAKRTEGKIGRFGVDTPEYQAMFASYVRQLEEYFRERGWLDKAYVYWFDEPGPKDYAFVRAGMKRLKKYAPGLTTMLTEQPEEALAGPIDIWCPISNRYNHAVAERRRSEGERFWWYVCCGPRTPYCTLFIDHPATELRVWFWQTWQRNIAGVLIWESSYWTSLGDLKQNPYEDPMSYVKETRPGRGQHWGNGDGRLLYPPLTVFGKKSGDGPCVEPPVSSIRWEMIREGLEDYEYLWRLRKLISERRGLLSPEKSRQYESLLEVPGKITRDVTTFTTDPLPIHARRKAVAESIEQLSE